MGDQSESGRRRGRPRVDEPRSTVTAYIPAEQHDRLIRAAQSRDESVSALLRRVITRWDRESLTSSKR